ncbi:5-(carboxyamino)imidazole ribonucleotide synthase [Synechococcales cyanobacterium C]|uniref:N5-carboxyaminoimidazole ribonucleotide synthase n=2 Tax=Petrachloros TaxID=2918834 RepID=A0A8K1ZVH9_9CYAN|nr:5-(carboxyamino)imidazole ribonucleotide synthase [Petrachloros mirabilis ULC683]
MERVGVIGGGQLAGLMIPAAQKLGIHLMIQTPNATDAAVANLDSAAPVSVVLAPLNDVSATAKLAQHCQVITFENEFVDLDALSGLVEQGVCFRPALSTLAPLLDKYEQRQYLQSLGLPVPTFAPFTVETRLEEVGLALPVVVKARRHGYDGQGTFIIRHAEALSQFWHQVQLPEPERSSAFLVEAFVPFERELAVMAARSVTGEVVTYPIVETYQPEQVCRWVIAPAELSGSLQRQIDCMVTTLLTQLQAVGIFGIELFLAATGQIWVNEIAPRTHNSGHLTLDACVTSQFEQHLRAICGLPLGATHLMPAGAVMVNLLGFETAVGDYSDQRHQLTQVSQAVVHWYGKPEARPGRKLGHVTVLLNNDDRSLAVNMAEQLEAIWYEQRS